MRLQNEFSMYILLLIGRGSFIPCGVRRSRQYCGPSVSRYPPAESAKQASTARPTLVNNTSVLEPTPMFSAR
jgi:hypothetical protein